MKRHFTIVTAILVFVMMGFHGMAQVTLGGSPTTTYVQNFDGMGTGTAAPTGWTTRTSATASSRGTATGALSVNTVGSTGGAFNNYPSASPGSGRALGIRQTGSFGDAGAAFEVEIANTTGRTNFDLSINHLILSDQPRTTAWSVQYSTNGTSWTTAGTFDGTASTTGTYDFGSGLDNKSSTVYIRIVALSPSTGSGNRDSYGIDDFSLSWTNAATGATKLALVSTPTTGTVATNLSSFTVEARKADNSVDNTYTSNITISKATGTGTLSGTVTRAAVAGVATFNDLQFNTAGTFTISAASGSLTGATSGNIVISAPTSSASDHFRSKASGNWNSNATWESSPNNTTWINATLVPNQNANTITVQGNHVVTATADITTTNTTIASTGTLNIDPAVSLTVPATKTITVNGKLVFKSSNLGTGRLAGSAGNITGNVTIERYIAGGLRGFRFLGNPFSTAMPLTQLTDDIDITGNGSDAAVPPFTSTGTNAPSAFSYDPSIESAGTVTVIGSGGSAVADPGWVAFPSASSTVGVGAGFRVLIRGTKGQTGTLTGANPAPLDVTLSATGPLNAIGDFTRTLVHAPGNPSFNLVSNPYPSPVNLKGITVGSGTNNNFWVFNVHQGTKGGYLAYAFGVDDYSLPSFGSVVAQSIASPDNVLTFHEADKTSTDTSTMLRELNEHGNFVEIKVNSGNIFWDRFLLQLDSKATDNRDAKWDADKFANSEVNLYSLSSNNNPLAIDMRPFHEGQSIPLGFQSNATRNFQFTIDRYSVADSIVLYLHDKYLGTETKMEEGMTYSFSTVPDIASQGENRFEIMQKKIAPLPILQVATSFVKIYPNPATDFLKVRISNPSNSVTNLVVLNEAGQIVKMINAGNLQDGEIKINVKGLAKGIYYLSVNNNKETKTERFQIQ